MTVTVRCISCGARFDDVFASVRHTCPRVAGPRLMVELERETPSADTPPTCADCGQPIADHRKNPLGFGCVVETPECKAINALPPARAAANLADLHLRCPVCLADVGDNCTGLHVGCVHVARRLLRLLAERNSQGKPP